MRILFGFIAGFLATLIFHQVVVALLWWAGVAPFGPFSMAATQPFGVPAVISLAFWGGVWGILFGLIDNGFPPGSANGFFVWRHSTYAGCSSSRVAAQGPTHGRWLATSSTGDGLSEQWCLGCWHRPDP
jgi:hypothetical protein